LLGFRHDHGLAWKRQRMKNFQSYILITSLLLNVFLAFKTSDYYKPPNVKVVKVVHKEGSTVTSQQVSENTTDFVINFISKIDCCDTFLWTVSENTKEIKYTIWFAK
jgi:hypothetical protein